MAAHALKGSVGAFAAGTAEEAARRLEQIGRDGGWAEAEEARAALEAAVGQLVPALAAVAGGPSPTRSEPCRS